VARSHGCNIERIGLPNAQRMEKQASHAEPFPKFSAKSSNVRQRTASIFAQQQHQDGPVARLQFESIPAQEPSHAQQFPIFFRRTGVNSDVRPLYPHSSRVWLQGFDFESIDMPSVREKQKEASHAQQFPKLSRKCRHPRRCTAFYSRSSSTQTAWSHGLQARPLYPASSSLALLRLSRFF
jgi:hypothetical protein